MLKTNREDYKKDLLELAYMFSDLEDIEIEHNERLEEGKFCDEFTVNGKNYKFENVAEYNGEIERKRLEKRSSKLGLYSVLKELYNVSLPWGALTGIRPTKMARTFGSSFENEFINTFDVSKEKVELVRQVIKTQCPIYDYEGKNNDLFIGIPFCPSRCNYCSFFSCDVNRCGKDLISNYVDALIKEIDGVRDILNGITSVYIGGGTPTCLPVKELERILNAINIKGVEYTVEAGRPDSIDEEKLALMQEKGVTRICVNPQTFSNATLEKMGRKHTAEDIIEKYNLARKFNFDINMDLIAGLESESVEDFKNSVRKAISLNPENITVHTLCLKRGSKLIERENRLAEGQISEMIEYAENELIRKGYNPYYLYRQKFMAGNLENVGYAKKGKECLYNVDVMEETSNNIALGANSVSKRVKGEEEAIIRYGAPKDVVTFIGKVDEIIKEILKLYE